MKIPKYIIELMGRSKYEFDFCTKNENYAAGYTVRISKYSSFQKAETFNTEIERLKAWVDRQIGGECVILDRPSETHYCRQYAVVTVFDPVMRHLEKYMPDL